MQSSSSCNRLRTCRYAALQLQEMQTEHPVSPGRLHPLTSSIHHLDGLIASTYQERLKEKSVQQLKSAVAP